MPKPPLGNRQLIRALNRSTVLNSIKTHGPIGRAQVARLTGLSPASITNLTAELLAMGLVMETEPGESSGGRRPILLELNPGGGFVIGIKLTEERVIAAITDLFAEVLAKREDPLGSQEPDQVVARIADTTTALLKNTKIPKKKLLGVGVGMAGVVDAVSGVSRQQPFFHWRDVPLGKMLTERLGVMTLVDNDVNTLTLAEQLYGAGQGVEDFLTVTIGRGVGLGIVAGGEVYRGARGGGGEFGHTVVEVNGPSCNCGKRGCLEAYVAEYSLLREAARMAERGEMSAIDGIDDLIRLGKGGDPAAQRIFANAGEVLGRGVANLINLFNPTLILISGEGVRIGDLMFDAMRATVETHTMPALRVDTEIRIDPWGDDAWVAGAASLVLREIFVSPLHKRPAQGVGE